MSKLTERYPGAIWLPASDDPEQLLKSLQPYLNWHLADIDTGSTDILLCDLRKRADGETPSGRLLLLSGAAVNIWLRHQGSGTA